MISGGEGKDKDGCPIGLPSECFLCDFRGIGSYGVNAMPDDPELLRQYSQDGSQEAFSELVRRNLPLVYSVARRRVNGDSHLAKDVAQRVFADLAQKAGVLSRHRTLAGWLFVSTRLAAAEAVRRERRQHLRGRLAQEIHAIDVEAVPEADREQLRASIDDLIGELGDRDREAVLLRFFEGLPYAEMGARLSLSENTARMRVERALERLRARFAQRGAKSTAAALGLVLAGQTGAAVPPGLAAAVAGYAVSSGAAAGGLSLLWQSITMNKIAIGILGIVAAAGIATSTGITRSLGVTTPDSQTPVSRRDNPTPAIPAAAVAPSAEPPAAMPRSVAAPTASPSQPANGGPEGFAPSQLDQQPVVLVQDPPVYPMEAKRAGLKGEVVVDYVIDANGNVRNATVIEPSMLMFEQTTLAAVNTWKFRPGRKNGRAVAARLRVPIEFR
jgi:RNA polymerase sigma factor (sigma-70 family)